VGGQVSWHIKRLWWFIEIYWRCKFGQGFYDAPDARQYGWRFAWYWSGRRAAISRMVDEASKPRIWVKP